MCSIRDEKQRCLDWYLLYIYTFYTLNLYLPAETSLKMFFQYMTFTKLNKIYNFGDLSDHINGHGFIGFGTDIEQVYIYFMGSEASFYLFIYLYIWKHPSVTSL